ncbi:MAG: N-acetylneuraminate synthase family protein [Lentisphaeraceae bacterium]|nr:N-acetylneuraminate synthase family protein [Lentisphaeraceae bacterium]
MKSFSNDLFFIAEIGGNHEGDFEYAKRLTQLGIDSGANAVKFQLYKGDTLVSRVEGGARNKHFKKFELSQKHYLDLVDMCEKANAMFMASVWDEKMLTWIDPYLSVHKVGAGDLTCFPMIKNLVKTGKPIILSTGLSTMEEVKQTVDFIYELEESYVTDEKLALLQCTSSYPCPDEDANLDAMLALKEQFCLPVGYSDHTVGSDAIEIAVAMGAQIIEKHFTDTRENKEFRDHKVSLTCEEVQKFLTKVKRIKKLKGTQNKFVTKSEKLAGHDVSFRRSVYAKCDLTAGEILTEENISVLRPAHGISSTCYFKLLGQRVNRNLDCHEVLKDSYIE